MTGNDTACDGGTRKHAALIGLDIGTSAIKGVVLNTAGHVLVKAERPVQYSSPRPGWAESDANAFFAEVCEVLHGLADRVSGPIHALSISGASGNTLLADAEGRPLVPIVNWTDRRTVGADLPALRGLTPAAVREVVGWPCIDSFPLAHLAWLKENRSDLYRKAAHVCMNTDWLTFRLTGHWAMDHSTATTFHLQDQVKACWHPPFLRRLGIAETQLSSLTHSGVSLGRLTAEAARATGLSADAQVITGAFDHPSAARAAGIRDPGQLLLSCGTSWVGFFPESDRNRIVEAKLLCDPFLAERGGPWGAMFSVPHIGRTVDAYVRDIIAPGEADPYAVFETSAANAAAGAGGLTIDLRKPAQPLAASRESISRAVMEGAARLLGEGLHTLRAHGFSFDRATLVGGPSRSRVWTSIVEAITDLSICTGDAYAGAVGAALLAGLGAGLFRDERTARPWSETETPPPTGQEQE